MANKAAEPLMRSPLKNPKQILQQGENIPIENKFTKDHVKENACIKANQMEEIRNKIKFRGEDRSEIQDYWKMNERLINRTSEKPVRDAMSITDDRFNFKCHKEMAIKMQKNDKQKNLERKNSAIFSVGKITEFMPMKRDLSKIQLEKNLIGIKMESERKMVKSKSNIGAIKGRNLLNK
jgi:hypothetical protein